MIDAFDAFGRDGLDPPLIRQIFPVEKIDKVAESFYGERGGMTCLRTDESESIVLESVSEGRRNEASTPPEDFLKNAFVVLAGIFPEVLANSRKSSRCLVVRSFGTSTIGL